MLSWIDISVNMFKYQTSFRTGYGHIQLKGEDGQRIPNATLFVKISIKEEDQKK